MTLHETCINDGKDKDKFSLDHTEIKRESRQWYDNELVLLFKKIFKPYILNTYGLNIDGWIYYKTNDTLFHDEILVLSKEQLIVKNIKTLSPTLYNLPSREEFFKKLKIIQKLNLIQFYQM